MGIPTLLHLSRIPLHAREHSCSSAFTVTGIAWDFHPHSPKASRWATSRRARRNHPCQYYVAGILTPSLMVIRMKILSSGKPFL